MRTNIRRTTGISGTVYRVTENLAGGQAFSVDPKLELASLMVTTLMEDKFYRDKEGDKTRIMELITQINEPLWVAKLALFTRKEFFLRSVTHWAAVNVLGSIKGVSWVRPFIRNLVERVDDMGEIVASWLQEYGKPLHSGMRKGLREAFNKFDDYQIAKYQMKKREVSLIDLVNLIHPYPTDRNQKALHALMTDKLSSKETWEALYTKAGQDAETEEELEEKKLGIWKKLLKENKLGYMALLRNLRNMISLEDSELIDLACARLVDEKAIRNSKVLPFRYLAAYQALQSIRGSSKALSAVNKAATIALDNVPSFPGKTLVVLDRSGSMNGKVSSKSQISCWNIGSLFAAAFIKKMDADLMLFSTEAKYVSIRKETDLFGAVDVMEKYRDGAGTDFHRPFQKMNRAYDRIIFLSDMQGWIGYTNPMTDLKKYEKEYSCKPVIYSFDLRGYGTLMFPQKRVFAFAGFSPRTLDIMSTMCDDPKAFMRMIDDVELV